MMNRSARQLQEPLIPVSILQSNRKFGGPVNRNDPVSQISKISVDRNEKVVNNMRNVKPQFYYHQNEEGFDQQNDKRYIISSFEPASIQANSVINSQNQKKEKQNRNRQFVAKVENINKMHQQISSLLQYVKAGHSKSLKRNQVQQQRSKTIDTNVGNNMNNIIKNRNKKQLSRKSIIQLSIQQSQIIPITQNQKNLRQINRSYNLKATQNKKQMQKTQFEPLAHFKNNFMNSFQPKLEGYQKTLQMLQKADHVSHEIYKNKNQLQIKCGERKKLQVVSPIVNNYRQNRKSPIKNFQNQNKQVTPNKNRYQYNFQGQDNVQMPNLKNLNRNFNEKNNKSALVDYDYQINRVKQRIQYSEQMTKKMQEKYSHHLHKNNTQSKNILQRYNQQNSNRYKQQQQSKNNKSSKGFQKQYRGTNFQLRVYPCQPKTHVKQKLTRDQVCRLIAQKISQQIKLDQRLRDARQMFIDSKTPDKWNILQQQLKGLGYSFTIKQLENQLSVTSVQSNPFNKETNKANFIQQLAEKYAKSEQYWEKNFFNFLSKKTIEYSGFQVKEMDLDQRGYLTIQDIVCFVNLYSSNFFRNRDALYLFRRLVALGKIRNGVQYESFLHIISSH